MVVCRFVNQTHFSFVCVNFYFPSIACRFFHMHFFVLTQMLAMHVLISWTVYCEFGASQVNLVEILN